MWAGFSGVSLSPVFLTTCLIFSLTNVTFLGVEGRLMCGTRVSAGGLVVRSFLGVALSDVSNLSPAAYQKPASAPNTPPSSSRRRRCTSSVNYKEPSISSYVPHFAPALLFLKLQAFLTNLLCFLGNFDVVINSQTRGSCVPPSSNRSPRPAGARSRRWRSITSLLWAVVE